MAPGSNSPEAELPKKAPRKRRKRSPLFPFILGNVLRRKLDELKAAAHQLTNRDFTDHDFVFVDGYGLCTFSLVIEADGEISVALTLKAAKVDSPTPTGFQVKPEHVRDKAKAATKKKSD